MGKTKWIICLFVSLFMLGATSVHADPIPDSNGMVVMQDGPNNEGDSFVVNVYFEAFDGLDASDPLGITPGKKQFAYIIEYISGNKKIGFFDVESINGVPILAAATSTTGVVNGVTAGPTAPIAAVVIPQPSGNQAARFVYKAGGVSSFGLAGDKSVAMVFTTDERFDIETSLAQMVDTSLSAAAEVVGPAECSGTIEGVVFCLECGPNGDVSPMEGVTIKVFSDGNEVAEAVTSENGLYSVTDLGKGTFTVAVDGDYEHCSKGSVDVEVGCNAGAVASFCVCPPACTQSICVTVACDQNNPAAPVEGAWVGLSKGCYTKWKKSNADGTVCFEGAKIVPGSYKVRVKAPKGYQLSGSSCVSFNLAECENKELTFNACPIPPCEESACVKVIKIVDGNEVPIEGVSVKLKKYSRYYKTGTTGTDGQACFDNLRPGYYVAMINVPDGYRLRDGGKCKAFKLKRCESETIEFVLCEVQLAPCPKNPCYWKTHPNEWPIEEMWVGADLLTKTQAMNILSGKMADGSNASRCDMSIKLAQYLVAVKLSLAAGSDAKDINPVVVASDEFLLYDYPPGSNPRGKGKYLARQLKNTLEEFIKDQSYCQD